jgi:hypothetical protein
MNTQEIIDTSLVSLDMSLTNIRGAMAALRQNKTYPADVSFSLMAAVDAVVFLNTAIEDLKDYQKVTEAKP